jgi:transposase-like protein/transposase
MEQILHGTATTTFRIRTEIQKNSENLTQKQLAERYHINVKTVQKWQKRTTIQDSVCGAKQGDNSSLSSVEEEIICQTRLKTLLPLDDLWVVLKKEIPALTRSNLHRCLQRNKLSRLSDLLPADEKEPASKKKFKDYPLGYLHIDSAQIHINGTKYYLFVAIDRTSKYVYVEVYDNKRIETAKLFLENTLKQYPYKINKILTDNGMEFTYELLVEEKRPKNRLHPFDEICQENSIEHRLTLFKHPCTNGQVERMNRKIKEHTSKKFHYDSIQEFKEHLYFYLLEYNFYTPLKILNYISPFEKIKQEYQKNKTLFSINPDHLIVGLNI